ASGGGMGTCGFVGIIEIISAYKTQGGNLGLVISGIILLMIVLPAVLSWAFALLFRKLKWIKDGDMKLPE
ncbi:MAG: PTS sugar transporter subunit IIC, partial [Clostridia bacterium]|nr:PTS sugar transporter subunit IIC [Clostridia bacterium]